MSNLPPIDEQIRVIKTVLEDSKKAIVMLGLMGAGKSMIGQELAKALDIHFIDSDDVIEANHGKISGIFALPDGEARFRTIERNVIQTIIAGDPRVLSTGGGAFVNEQTRALINDKGVSVWLDLSPEETVARFDEEAIATRPLLANAEEGPLAKLKDLYAERSGAYGQAHVRVVLSDQGASNKEESIQQNRNRVINALYMHLKP